MNLDDLLIELGGYSDNPHGFVLFAFPWGEPDTELAHRDGPEPWQEEVLKALASGLINVQEAIQIARTSGHGIGKSALVAWIILWAISTFEDTKGVVTANTEVQLKTKTWAELAKWYRLFIGNQLFKMTATALFSRDPEHEKTWRVDMVPWSEMNTEAFSGLHNQDKRILILFDEASAIPDLIWEVTEGALTDEPPTQIIWCCFGNPTRNTGRFRDCFSGGKFAHRWQSAAIDSRTVSFTNKAQFQRWIDDYGEDSDFVRVRVRGIFPRVDAESFISFELAREATTRDLPVVRGQALVVGVDVGRFGDDPSVIYARKGRDARSIPPLILPSVDTMELAARVMQFASQYAADFVFVDEGGVGGGVVDRLNQLNVPVIGVDFGAKPDGITVTPGTKYANKRAEIWGALREWLTTGAIPDTVNGAEISLVDEMCGPTYGLNSREAIQLEAKKDMRRRGVPSPNMADALACTFALPDYIPSSHDEDVMPTEAEDYNPFEKERIYG